MLKKWLLFTVVLLSFSVIAVNVQGKQAIESEAFSPPVNQIIVQFSAETGGNKIAADQINGRVQQLSAAIEVALQYARPMSGDAHVLQLPSSLPVEEVELLAAKIAAQDGVAYAEPDYIRQLIGAAPSRLAAPLLIPNDTSYGSQWHYNYTAGTAEGLNLPAAWNITTGAASTVVAVIDTGILNHADLAGRVVGGYDFISSSFVANDGGGRDNDPSDPGDWITTNQCGYPHSARDSSWHGTHVAGTIGAATDNGLGVAGVNWNAKILPVRVLGKCGGSTSDIVDGMRWAAGLPVTGVPANANPAKVLNLSLGGSGSCSTSEQNAINAITAAGSTVVVAAGNDNANASNFTPASCNGVITVASNDRSGNKAYYSNYGSVVEVTAPGGETTVSASNGVLSTLDGGATGPSNDNSYAYYQGTSMAAPHVAGVVSLLLAKYPALTPGEISQRLQSTARPFPSGSSCNTSICGAGIVDAFNALSTSLPNFYVYLPAALKATTTQSNPFTNPGFESGPTGWTGFSTHGWDVIVQSFTGSVRPHAGSWAAWLGGDHDDVSYIQQQVTVPSGAPYLSYWHWIASGDVCGYDLGGVIVGNQVVDVYNLCETTSTGGWVQHSVNLSAYAGQLVSIKIQVETDGTLNSNLFVDDVSFQAGPSSTPPLSKPPTNLNEAAVSRAEALP